MHGETRTSGMGLVALALLRILGFLPLGAAEKQQVSDPNSDPYAKTYGNFVRSYISWMLLKACPSYL